MQRTALITFLLMAFGGSALAEVSVTAPWVRATTASRKSTVAFMQLTSSDDARLVKAQSPLASQVEIHQMVMKNYRMTMQAVADIELPAGQPVELRPDGYMVMLMGLKQPILEGDSIPISIVVEGKNKKRETIAFTAVAMNRDDAAHGKEGHTHLHVSAATGATTSGHSSD